MKVSVWTLALVLGTYLCAAPAQAAFIVEANGGKGNANFSSLGHSTSTTPSTALGTSAPGSIFGNPSNSTGPDQYTFHYTPGTDVDNTTYNLGDILGNSSATDADGAGAGLPAFVTASQLATGLTGGVSGLYNVYITVPPSTNVNAAGSLIDITSDAATISLNPVNLNNTGTGPNTNPNVDGAYIGGANNMWLKIATVPLTAGVTYSVTMTANAPTFVSQRGHGVMWERAVPEPSSLLLAAIGCIALATRRKRV